MSNKIKRIEILSEVEIKETISRLTFEIIEKVKNLDNLLLVGIPTRGIDLAELLEKELLTKTGVKIRKGIIDPTFYRDDQNRVGTRIIEATDIPTPIEKQEILLVDDVIYTGRTIRAAIDALYSWGRPQKVMLLVMVDRGHRELPIQPDFCGKKVPTSKRLSSFFTFSIISEVKREIVFLSSTSVSITIFFVSLDIIYQLIKVVSYFFIN